MKRFLYCSALLLLLTLHLSAQEHVQIPVVFEFRCPVHQQSDDYPDCQTLTYFDSTHNWLDIDSYADGKRTGFCYRFGNSMLDSLTQWLSGEPSGVWFMNRGDGRGWYTMSCFGNNTIAPQYTEQYPSQFLSRIFDSEGYLKEEGWFIYYGDPEIDPMRFGVFRYYSKGRLIKTKNFLVPTT